MPKLSRGFSLIELLVALSVTLVLGMMMFQFFRQNERVIRDQTLIMEMQQTARIVASQIADEIRMAGQGVPVHQAKFGPPSEETAIFLGSSSSTRIDFRAGLSNVQTTTLGSGPMTFTLGMAQTISVMTTSGFIAGRHTYVWDAVTWLRAQVTAVSSTTLTLLPARTAQFAGRPTIALEEAVSIYFNSGSVRRATASDFSDPANPQWSAANEIGRNFRALTFTYFDANGNLVAPTSIMTRTAIARIDVRVTVEVSGPLSDGSRPTYSLTRVTIPRNARL